jgi:tetratricopeptide (TPR) repeat protein
MKSASRLLILVLACCVLTASAFAQSPREQLQQMVEQLRKTPGDNALREQIVKLGTSIRPAPAITEEARRPFVRAATALKDAKTEPEYARAVVLYREALAIAPWWGDAYYNLAKAQELRGDFREAMDSLKFFILAAPPAADARQAQDQIYALEERLVRKTAEANSPEARAAKQKIKDDDLLKSLEGAVFSHSYTNVERQYRISNGRAEVRDRRITSGSPLCSDGAQRSGPIGEQMTCPDRLAVRFTGRHGRRSHDFGIDSFEIAEDGRTLLVKQVFNSEVTNIVFRRQ